MHRATVGEPDADRADLARRGTTDPDPHTGILVEAADVVDTQLLQRADDEPLDRADVIARTEGVGHVDDGIAHQLTGPVIGDVATALDRDEFGIDRGRLDQHVHAEVSTRAVGEHVGMFEQQQAVVGAVLEHRLLQRERLAVRDPSQPTHMERPGRGHGI